MSLIPKISPTTREKILERLYYFLIILIFIQIILTFVYRIISTIEDPRLEIDSLSVSNLNLTFHPNQISADWNVQMNFKTLDNHGYFNLSSIKILIYYSDKLVGVTNFMPLDISPKNPPMHFGGEFSSRLLGYIDDSVISDIVQGSNVTSTTTLNFNVELSASVIRIYKGWGTDSWPLYLWVFKCQNVELIFGSSGASKAHMLNGSGKCKKAMSEPFYRY
ncbi:hypothetical protein POM88_001533 [Heracleum sosnowskyi]|uniref:Late embryogenesis abundant protein LEA-2 subgroup domain-containing protein n=1 Tax=Heracleum sosnowskyi TaxID=360622 RepID=A0AAD8NBS4_9APIA|nr:hypothetical protein POM88_001533 [Heracleum sosnowskyi]